MVQIFFIEVNEVFEKSVSAFLRAKDIRRIKTPGKATTDSLNSAFVFLSNHNRHTQYDPKIVTLNYLLLRVIIFQKQYFSSLQKNSLI